MLTHRDLQFDFPKYQPPTPPQWLIEFGKFLAHYWPVFRVLGWIVAIGVVGLLLYALVRQLLRQDWFSPSEKVAQTETPQWHPAADAARNLLRDADALAALGKYGDAVHLLLLRSIEHIDTHRPELVRPAFTSREIGALEQLPPTARPTFMGIARVVERALFAGREIDAAEFAQCRRAYEQFAFPGTWRAAA
jgi:hypothetical protein